VEQLAKHRGTGKAELAQTSVIMEQAAFSFVTVYLAVYDHLSSWYGTEGVAQKPHRNRHFLESQMSTEVFGAVCRRFESCQARPLSFSA
jgi:hypothetical protein